MAINIATEEMISLSQAASELPGRKFGRTTSRWTVYRWAKQGCRGQKLETVCVGGTLFTSRQALHRFFGELKRSTGPGGPP